VLVLGPALTTYTYQLENLDPRQKILSFSIDIRSDSSRATGSIQDLQARVPVANRITELNIDRIGAENVTRTAPTVAPLGWDAAVTADASFEFHALSADRHCISR
jgi:hypothetical protein